MARPLHVVKLKRRKLTAALMAGEPVPDSVVAQDLAALYGARRAYHMARLATLNTGTHYSEHERRTRVGFIIEDYDRSLIEQGNVELMSTLIRAATIKALADFS